MSRITITGFKGIRPRVDPKLLDSSEGVIADNANLTSGALAAWRAPLVSAGLAITGEVKTIFKYDETHWLQFNEDVDVVRGPISGDTKNRHYYTGIADGMRVTNDDLVDPAGGTSIYPEDSYLVGVPIPTVKPTVALNKVTGVITNATAANPVVITSSNHGRVTGQNVLIADVVGMTEINDREFIITVIDVNSFSLDSEDGTTHTAYTSGGTWTRVFTQNQQFDRKYVYTLVNSWGEESAPSPVSVLITVGYDDNDTETVDLTGMNQTITGDYVPVTDWRIYRIATGTVGAKFLFVAEVTINASTPQYLDDVFTADLQDAIQTTSWSLPATTMRGLTMMGNGIMAGFDGNDICFSEPFVPYAWPDSYRITINDNVIGVGAFDNSLVVVTVKFPYVITGTTPESMSHDKITQRYPGLSKRGIVEIEGGVIYPSPAGLAYVSSAGVQVVTEKHYTRTEWMGLNPAALIGDYYDGRYVAIIPSNNKILFFSRREGILTEISEEWTAIYADPEGDNLFYVGTDNVVKQFNGGGTRLNATFRSKNFALSGRTKLTCGKIYADFEGASSQDEIDAIAQERQDVIDANAALLISGALGAINDYMIGERDINGDVLSPLPTIPDAANYIIKILDGGGNVIYETEVNDNEPFRIDIPDRRTEYIVEVSGKYPVQKVVLASSIPELKDG